MASAAMRINNNDALTSNIIASTSSDTETLLIEDENLSACSSPITSIEQYIHYVSDQYQHYESDMFRDDKIIFYLGQLGTFGRRHIRCMTSLPVFGPAWRGFSEVLLESDYTVYMLDDGVPYVIRWPGTIWPDNEIMMPLDEAYAIVMSGSRLVHPSVDSWIIHVVNRDLLRINNRQLQLRPGKQRSQLYELHLVLLKRAADDRLYEAVKEKQTSDCARIRYLAPARLMACWRADDYIVVTFKCALKTGNEVETFSITGWEDLNISRRYFFRAADQYHAGCVIDQYSWDLQVPLFKDMIRAKDES